MPYICLARAIQDGTVYIGDLAPNESLRSPTIDPPGQTRYVNRVQNEIVPFSTTTGKTIKAAKGLSAYLLDRVVPGGNTAATGTIICASVSVADTVTIAGVVFTAAGAADLPNQVFNQSGIDSADATSLAAAINHASAQALITAALGGGRTISASAGTNIVTLTAGGTDYQYVTLGTLASSNGTRLAVSGTHLNIASGGLWTGTQLATASANLIARVDAGSSMTISAVNTVLAAVVANTSLTAGSTTSGTLADILSILAGREYYIPADAQIFQTALLPLFVKAVSALGSFTRANTVWDSQMVSGELRPLATAGDTENVERKPIRSTVDGSAFQLSLAGGELSRLTGSMSLFPDSDALPFIPGPYQKALAVSGTNLTSQRVVTVYADDGSLLA